MDHLAIMKKSWKLLPKILSGQKRIESRWYKSKTVPWDRIKTGETVYFKDSGSPVTIKAEVENVLQFSELTSEKVKALLLQYGYADGLAIDELPKFYERFKDKRYCLLVVLKNPQKIVPFDIDKKGYGLMAAWITLENINQIKIRTPASVAYR